MPKKKKTIYILVSGGLVQRTWGSDPDIDIVVIDEDNGEYDLKVRKKNATVMASVKKKTNGGRLHQLF